MKPERLNPVDVSITAFWVREIEIAAWNKAIDEIHKVLYLCGITDNNVVKQIEELKVKDDKETRS